MKFRVIAIAAGVAFALSGCTALLATVSGEVILDTQLLEQTIEEGVFDQTGLYAEVACPSMLSGEPGDVRQCTLEDEFGGLYFVDVTIQNREGEIVWEVRP